MDEQLNWAIFEKCMPIIFKHEGGYVWHKLDPGGETRYGIAKKFFPNEDIKNLTKNRAKELYFDYYWSPMNLVGINDYIAILHIFDHGINAGRQRGVKIAQRLVGVLEDGLCGNITRAAINNYEGDFVADYIEKRKEYYQNLVKRKPTLSVFLKGWINRVNSTNF